MTSTPDPGAVLLAGGCPREALDYLYSRTVREYRNPIAWANLAVCYRQLNIFDLALESAAVSISIDPTCTAGWNCKASTLEDLGEFIEAEDAYRKALEFSPPTFKAQSEFNHAQSLMRLGRFPEAWRKWEVGRFAKSYMPLEGIDPWDGSDLSGKRVLVFKEGGYGDGICFARWLSELHERDAKVWFLCWDRLAPLLDKAFRNHTNVTILPESRAGECGPEDFDYQIPLLSLPHICGMKTWADIPSSLKIEPKAVDYQASPYAGMLRHDVKDRHVGICWRAEECATARKFRSIPVEALDPLANIPGVKFYSLCPHKAGLHENDDFVTPSWMTDITMDLTDWSDTAAFIANLDLVVTADTAVAHLAGAMGKETWMLNPMRTDWKWGEPCADPNFGFEYGPWYRAMRVFRQDHPISWDSVIQNVKQELEAL
jgi:hypothetical protein